MHIVYLMVFDREQLPNLYIGSKSNCSIIDGKIYGKNNKLYEGSCASDSFRKAKKSCNYKIQVLGEFLTYDEALLAERNAHLANNVVASPLYFNRIIATTTNYTNPDYATYKHVLSGKIARLQRNHPDVLNGSWVGVTKGTILSEEQRKSRGLSGEYNSFYGKTHSDKSKKIIGNKNAGRIKTEEEISNWIEKVAKLSPTVDHRRSISASKKDKITLKNFITGECVQIPREDSVLYNKEVWKNPATIQVKSSCSHCGVISTVGNIVRWHNDNCKRKNYENTKD